uniref:Uncharacterized protein n=2 Tax=Chrysotila carterae TaxID=13221 RepID=A0A7S4BF00_CHRCT
MADSIVDGPLVMGTQQQYFVRNSRLKQGVEGTSMNYVFVGTEGAPESSPTGQVTTEDSTPAVAAKPYLIEEDGVWSILVPKLVKGSVGPLSSSQDDTVVPMSQVYVARPGDTARTINTGIQGMRALLITPAVYDLNGTVVITESNFVVLGLGFATLVSRNGHSALQVSENAAGVRVAGVLFESGSALKADAISSPLVEWAGPDGVASDLFTRAGSFSNSPSRCLQVRQDVHARIGGDGVVVDNTWMWHADHDDCGGASDGAFSGNGLVVQGRNVVAYGLKVEHMMRNLVEWYGENGETYLYQSELPYHAPTFNGVGYYVHPSVRSHKALAIGVYIVGDLIAQTGIRVPPTANLKNAFAWVITGAHSQFHSVVCTNTSTCYFGQRCTYNACYQYELPQVLKGGGVGSLPRPALSEDRSGYSTGGEGYLPEFA